MTDQNATVHTYAYDKLGRNLSDSVSVSDPAIDATVGGLQSVYEVRGLRSHVKSLNTNRTAVLNEVQWVRNDFGQMVAEYQEHGGSVGGSSLHVDYTYADPSDPTTPNTLRPTSIQYPNTTEITSEYGSEIASALSRPDALKEGSTVLSSYRFLGSSTNVGVKYDAAASVELTYENGSTGDAGDKYTGLDRFGRLVETIWKPTSGSNLIQSQYGLNAFGGVVWRRDDLAHAMSKPTEDNYYWYDGLYQVQQHKRGTLNNYQTGIESPAAQIETFAYDAMGNWLAYETQVPALNQGRSYNQANEITALHNPSSVVQPDYDATGNMTIAPKVGSWSTSCALKWDAWNRLVRITQGPASPINYTYDALTRRIKTVGTETRRFYYNNQWRAVEERVGTTPVTDTVYVWGILNRWDMVLRRKLGVSTLNHYVLKDYLDPMAIIHESGAVVERFSYDAFGPVRFLEPDFVATSPNLSPIGWNFLFHAEFQDTATGLYNYGYRYYHPKLGRWLSRDPLGEKEGTNLHQTCRNSPLYSVDVYGGNVLVGVKTGAELGSFVFPGIGTVITVK